MKRIALFLTAGAALLAGGCPKPVTPEPNATPKDFTAFVKDVVVNDADAEPVSVDGIEFTFDESDVDFADLFSQSQS